MGVKQKVHVHLIHSCIIPSNSLSPFPPTLMHVKMSLIGTVAAGDTRQVGRGLAYCCRGVNFGTWGATVCFPLCTDAIPCLLDHSSMLLWPIIWTLPQAVTCLLGSPWRRRPLECFGLIQSILHALADYNCSSFTPCSDCFKCICVTQWLEYGGNRVRCCVGEFSCMNIVYEYLFCYWVSSTLYANRLLYICVGGCLDPGCNSCKFLVDLCVSDPIVEPCPFH